MTRLLIVVAVFLALSRPAHADEAHAKVAYDEATDALERGDYEAAARAYYRADLASPHDDALVAALVAVFHTDAALLAMRLAQRTARSPYHRRLNQLRKEAGEKFGHRVGRIIVRCSGCEEIMVDNVEVADRAATVVRIGVHQVSLKRHGRAERREVQVRAGASIRISPRGARTSRHEEKHTGSTEPTDATEREGAPDPDDSPSPSTASSGVSPALFWVGFALTLGAAGGTVASGVDLSAKFDAFEASPSEGTAATGDSAQARTHALIGVSAGLAVFTTLIGAFATDWGNDLNVGLEGATLRVRF